MVSSSSYKLWCEVGRGGVEIEKRVGAAVGQEGEEEFEVFDG